MVFNYCNYLEIVKMNIVDY